MSHCGRRARARDQTKRSEITLVPFALALTRSLLRDTCPQLEPFPFNFSHFAPITRGAFCGRSVWRSNLRAALCDFSIHFNFFCFFFFCVCGSVCVSFVLHSAFPQLRDGDVILRGGLPCSVEIWKRVERLAMTAEVRATCLAQVLSHQGQSR